MENLFSVEITKCLNGCGRFLGKDIAEKRCERCGSISVLKYQAILTEENLVKYRFTKEIKTLIPSK